MIKDFFLKVWHHWKVLLRNHDYFVALVFSIILLVFAFSVNFLASSFNDTQVYLSVGDLLLDHLPTYDLHYLFIWGFYVILLCVFFYTVFLKPEIAPFAMKAYAILILVRCGSILLTNVGPPIGFFYAGSPVVGTSLSDLFFRNDLFFSGHTAYPFLAFLLFRNSPIRWFFLVCSLVMAATVLAMHVHYSIDVFAAFFITHGTYVLSDKVFVKSNRRYRELIKKYGWHAFQRKLKNRMEKIRSSIS